MARLAHYGGLIKAAAGPARLKGDDLSVSTDTITGRWEKETWLFFLPNRTRLDLADAPCSVQAVFDLAVEHGWNVHIRGGAMSGSDTPPWITCTRPVVLRPSLYLHVFVENVIMNIQAGSSDGLTLDSQAGLQFRWLGQIVYGGNASAVRVRASTPLPASGGAPGPRQFLNSNVYIGTIAQAAGSNKASAMVRFSADVGSISTNVFEFEELNGGGSDLQPVQCHDGVVIEGTTGASGPSFNGNDLRIRQAHSFGGTGLRLGERGIRPRTVSENTVDVVMDPGSAKVSAAGCAESWGEGNLVTLSCTANGSPGHRPRTGLVQGSSSTRNKFIVLVNDAAVPRHDESNHSDIVMESNAPQRDDGAALSAVLAEVRQLRSEVAAVKADNAALRETVHQSTPANHSAETNVRAFGADCNGNPLHDDSEALQAAIDSFPQNEWACRSGGSCDPDRAGGVLIIPGICYIKTALVVDKRSFLLRGVGRSVSGLRALAPFAPASTGKRALLTIYFVDTFVVADMAFDGADSADVGIDLVTTLSPDSKEAGRSININLDRIQIINTRDGILCPETGQVSELTFVDLWLAHNHRSGFSCGNGAVMNVRFIGGQFESSERPITNETACYTDTGTGDMFSCIFDLRGGSYYFFDPFLAIQDAGCGWYKGGARLHVFGGGSEVHPFPATTHAKIVDTTRRQNLMGVGGELSMHGFIVSGWGSANRSDDQVAIRLQQQGQVMLTSCDFEWGVVQWSPPPYRGSQSAQHPAGDTETQASLVLIGSRMLNDLRAPGNNASSVIRLGAGQTGPQTGGLWPNSSASPSPFVQIGESTLMSRSNEAGQTQLCATFSDPAQPVCFATEPAMKSDDGQQWGGVVGGDVQWGGWPWHGKAAQQAPVLKAGDPPGPFLRPTDWVANLTARFDPRLVVLNLNPPMVSGLGTNYPRVQPQALHDLVDLLVACQARRLRALFMVSLNCATSDTVYNRSYHTEPPIDERGPWWPHCAADFAEQAGLWFRALVGGTEDLARTRGGEALVETILAWAPQANNDLAGSETRLDVQEYVPDITQLGHALYSLPASRARLASPLVFGLPISVPASVSPSGLWSSCGPEQTYRNVKAVCDRRNVQSPPVHLPVTYDHRATNISALLAGAAAMGIGRSNIVLTDFKISSVPDAKQLAKIRSDMVRLRPRAFWLWQNGAVPDTFYRDFLRERARPR